MTNQLDTLPETLPAGTRYTVDGHEYELLEPSIPRENGTYPAVRRRSDDGSVHDAPTGSMVECQSLEMVTFTLPDMKPPEPVRPDPYAEHRKKIGDDK